MTFCGCSGVPLRWHTARPLDILIDPPKHSRQGLQDYDAGWIQDLNNKTLCVYVCICVFLQNVSWGVGALLEILQLRVLHYSNQKLA